MAGKWAAFKNTLPALDRAKGDSDRRAKLDAIKEQLNQHFGNDYTEALDELSILKDKKKNLDAKLREINLAMEATEEFIQDNYDARGITSMKKNGYNFYESAEPYPSVESQEELFIWAMENGHEKDLTMNWNTLKRITKEKLEEENVLPAGVKVYMKTTINRRKA